MTSLSRKNPFFSELPHKMESRPESLLFNKISDLNSFLNSKAEIIQSLKKEVAESQLLKEENTKLRFENAKLLSEASGASLNHAAEIQSKI